MTDTRHKSPGHSRGRHRQRQEELARLNRNAPPGFRERQPQRPQKGKVRHD